jgi:hypothetical protein
MNDLDVKRLSKVDETRRSFLKKAAIGSAYAIPVMTTFSLDGIRSKARAQGVYGNPTVVSLETAPPSAFGGDASAQDLPELLGYWVITYDRPMDKNFSSAKICDREQANTETCESEAAVGDCTIIKPDEDGCPDCESITWAWNKDGTKEYGEIRDIWSPSFRLKIFINHGDCKDSALYRDLAGNILEPWGGCALFCRPIDH